MKKNSLNKLGNITEFDIKCNDVEEAGVMSVNLKRLLKKIGVDNAIVRRIAIACYEAEINVVIHSVGGKAFVIFEKNRLDIIFKDNGPGIKNIERAMQRGFSTANEYARTNGFGAGMGLPNIKELSDLFEIESTPKGTKLTIKFYLGDINEVK